MLLLTATVASLAQFVAVNALHLLLLIVYTESQSVHRYHMDYICLQCLPYHLMLHPQTEAEEPTICKIMYATITKWL